MITDISLSDEIQNNEKSFVISFILKDIGFRMYLIEIILLNGKTTLKGNDKY